MGEQGRKNTSPSNVIMYEKTKGQNKWTTAQHPGTCTYSYSIDWSWMDRSFKLLSSPPSFFIPRTKDTGLRSAGLAWVWLLSLSFFLSFFLCLFHVVVHGCPAPPPAASASAWSSFLLLSRRMFASPGLIPPLAICLTRRDASGLLSSPLTFNTPVPKQTWHTKTPLPKHWGHSVYWYWSFGRFLSKAFHLPVPPQRSPNEMVHKDMIHNRSTAQDMKSTDQIKSKREREREDLVFRLWFLWCPTAPKAQTRKMETP